VHGAHPAHHSLRLGTRTLQGFEEQLVFHRCVGADPLGQKVAVGPEGLEVRVGSQLLHTVQQSVQDPVLSEQVGHHGHDSSSELPP
jgi:hypothetical protein